MSGIPTSPDIPKGSAPVSPEPAPVAAPQPLPCRLAGLLGEWRTARDKFRSEGNTEAEIATEACMQHLHETVNGFFADVQEWQERRAAS